MARWMLLNPNSFTWGHNPAVESATHERWGSLEAWVDVPGDPTPRPLNGPVPLVNGQDGPVDVPVEVHQALLEELEATLPGLEVNGIVEGSVSAVGLRVRFRAGRIQPHCLSCSAPLAEVPRTQDSLLWCPRCRHESNVMPTPWWLAVRIPTAVQMVGAARTPSELGQPAIRWFTRFEGEPTEPELDVDDHTEEEALERLGITEDPRELRKALRFATSDNRRDDLNRQLELLAARVASWEVAAGELAKPWAWASLMLAGISLPVALFPALALTLIEAGAWQVQGDPGLAVELVGLIALLIVVPSIAVSQHTVRVRAGISAREAFNQVGFYAVLGLIPGLGALLVLAKAVPLGLGRVTGASVEGPDGALLRPHPVTDHIPISWYGLPAAGVLVGWGLGIQWMYFLLMQPLLNGM